MYHITYIYARNRFDNSSCSDKQVPPIWTNPITGKPNLGSETGVYRWSNAKCTNVSAHRRNLREHPTGISSRAHCGPVETHAVMLMTLEANMPNKDKLAAGKHFQCIICPNILILLFATCLECVISYGIRKLHSVCLLYRVGMAY